MAKQTSRPRFEVADVIRVHGGEYRRTHRPSIAQEKVLRNIATCRTASLGGHVDECHSCGHVRISYNSCRDRHCPKCQNVARAEWLESRLERLLPVPYFHVVFTIPGKLNPVALRNKKVVFDILFAAAAQTLQQVANDEKHLGAKVGFTGVLHTWGQNILFHPHLHCVVTGGGLSPNGDRWVPSRKDYFLPVKVLSRLFRGKFLHALRKAHEAGRLDLDGSAKALADAKTWRDFIDGLYGKDWVVYAKPPFGGPEHVFRYLGRYTHRVAISNHRIVGFDNGRVTFTFKDYAKEGKRKPMTLDAVEFIRRFLLHVLPKGYTRIRHFGLCASQNVYTKLESARRLLEPTATTSDNLPRKAPAEDHRTWCQRFLDRTGIDVMACPSCNAGQLVRRRTIDPIPRFRFRPTGTDPVCNDTS